MLRADSEMVKPRVPTPCACTHMQAPHPHICCMHAWLQHPHMQGLCMQKMDMAHTDTAAHCTEGNTAVCNHGCTTTCTQEELHMGLCSFALFFFFFPLSYCCKTHSRFSLSKENLTWTPKQ